MSIYTKASGAYHHVATLFYKIAGVWKQVRAVYIKKNGVWVQSYGNNEFIIYALGLFQTVYPRPYAGLWLNGQQYYTLGPNWDAYLGGGVKAADEPWPPANQTNTPVKRSYNLVLFDKYGNIDPNTRSGDFYPTPEDSTATALVSFIQALPAGQRYAFFSWDVPGANSTWVSPAISALGGDTSAFDAGLVPPHSGYVLVGKKGQSPFYQALNGSREDTPGVAPDGAVRFKFGIVEGEFVALSG